MAVRARLLFVPTEAAATDAWVWVVGQRRTRPWEAVLVRVDPGTGRVRGTFHLGSRAAPRLAAGHGAVWLAFHPRARDGRLGVVGIEERTGTLRLRRRLRGAPAGLAAGERGVWVLAHRGPAGSRLLLLDPGDGTRARVIRAPPWAGGVAAASDLVWVSSPCGGTRCDVTRASVRAYAQASGRLLAGPFPTRCAVRPRSWFFAGMAAMGRSAMVLAGDGRGGMALVIASARRGVSRCLAL